MKEQTVMDKQTDSASELNQFECFYIEYKRQQDAQLLIRQLNQMIKAVQRHRGMSMAILAGSDLFKAEFMGLQKQVERRLTSLEVFAKRTAGVLSGRDQESLHGAWQTIRGDWQDDDVMDNFELHSHFIEQLQAMIAKLSKRLERPPSAVVAESAIADGGSQASRRIELLNFAAVQLPLMVEQIAKIRGLATYAAGREECEYHHDRKLRYAMTRARELSQKIHQQAGQLQGVSGVDKLRSLGMVKDYEMKLTFLFNTVDMDILSDAIISTNSHHLFKLATEIIDTYLKVIDESMDLIGRWHEEDLEGWLSMDKVLSPRP